MHKYIDVARIVSPKGLDGRVTLYCAQNVVEHIISGINFDFVPPKIDVPRFGTVSFVEKIDERQIIVSIDTISTIDDAEALVGCHCLISQSQANSLGIDLTESTLSACSSVLDLFDFDIKDAYFPIGWNIIDVASGYSAEVFEVLNPAGQILLNVDEKSQRLIPFVDDFIDKIDEPNKTVYMNLPKGLVDL